MNSRGFDESVEAILGARLPDDNEAILMLDIDHFKAFNDRSGHRRATRRYGHSPESRDYLRKDDLPARYGGEEFAVHLRGMDRPSAINCR